MATIIELKNRAKKAGIPKYSTMSKAELEAALARLDQPTQDRKKEVKYHNYSFPKSCTVDDIRTNFKAAWGDTLTLGKVWYANAAWWAKVSCDGAESEKRVRGD